MFCFVLFLFSSLLSSFFYLFVSLWLVPPSSLPRMMFPLPLFPIVVDLIALALAPVPVPVPVVLFLFFNYFNNYYYYSP